MDRRIFKFEKPDRCVIGAIGSYPDQSYFLQVTDAGEDVTVQMDFRQVRLLGKRIDQLLDSVSAHMNIHIPAKVKKASDQGPLHMPVDSEFFVGSIGLGWDMESLSLIIEVMDFTSLPVTAEMMLQDSEEGPDTLRISLSSSAARQFARRALEVYAAGRPLCPLCGEPLDEDGHICARLNGYRRDLSNSQDNLGDYLG